MSLRKLNARVLFLTDWFFPWPVQALEAVAGVFISDENALIPAHHRDAIIAHVVDVHISVEDYTALFLRKWRRINYSTPKNFLDFIDRYLQLLDSKDKYIRSQV